MMFIGRRILRDAGRRFMLSPMLGLGLGLVLVLLLLLLPLARLAAQVSDTTTTGRTGRDSALWVAPPQGNPKDPRLATALGVLHPGLGHYYAGEYARGFRIESITIGSFLVGIAVAVPPSFTDPRPVSRTRRDLVDAGIAVAAIVGATAWIYGAIDAPRAARRENQIHGFGS